jgi:hypothetical protein
MRKCLIPLALASTFLSVPLSSAADVDVSKGPTSGTVEGNDLVIQNAGQSIRIGKTDYKVTCSADKANPKQCFTIETYGDIAANIEAAATCTKHFSHPGYGLSKGSC